MRARAPAPPSGLAHGRGDVRLGLESGGQSRSRAIPICWTAPMTLALALAAAAFVLTLVLGYPGLAVLRRAGVGKQVSAYEPASHASKTGTPTMGGVLFIAPVVALIT